MGIPAKCDQVVFCGSHVGLGMGLYMQVHMQIHPHISHPPAPIHIQPRPSTDSTHSHTHPQIPHPATSSHTHPHPSIPTHIYPHLCTHPPTHTLWDGTSCCGECVSMYSCARPTPLNLIPPSLVRRGSRTRVCVWGWGGGLSSSSNRFFNLGVMEGEYL